MIHKKTLIFVFFLSYYALKAGPIWDAIQRQDQKTDRHTIDRINQLMCSSDNSDKRIGCYALAAMHFRNETIIHVISEIRKAPLSTIPYCSGATWFSFISYGFMSSETLKSVEKRLSYYERFMKQPHICCQNALADKLRIGPRNYDYYTQYAHQIKTKGWEKLITLIVDGSVQLVEVIPTDGQIQLIRTVLAQMEHDCTNNIAPSTIKPLTLRTIESDEQMPETPPTTVRVPETN